MIRKDMRMSLVEHSQGIHLQIRNLDVDDAGNYICEVENEAEPIQQTNQLQILGELTFIFLNPTILWIHYIEYKLSDYTWNAKKNRTTYNIVKDELR